MTGILGREAPAAQLEARRGERGWGVFTTGGSALRLIQRARTTERGFRFEFARRVVGPKNDKTPSVELTAHITASKINLHGRAAAKTLCERCLYPDVAWPNFWLVA